MHWETRRIEPLSMDGVRREGTIGGSQGEGPGLDPAGGNAVGEVDDDCPGIYGEDRSPQGPDIPVLQAEIRG